MASIWKPTRSDSFSSDMLPTGGSSDLGLMSGQQPDDFVDENRCACVYVCMCLHVHACTCKTTKCF